MVDNLHRQEIELLQNDSAYRAKVANGKTEARAIARLFDVMSQHGRIPTVRAIPAEDMFMLLDDDAIRETFKHRNEAEAGVRPFDPYPGHALARAEFDATHDRWTGTR